jgi:hypothetical protein
MPTHGFSKLSQGSRNPLKASRRPMDRIRIPNPLYVKEIRQRKRATRLSQPPQSTVHLLPIIKNPSCPIFPPVPPSFFQTNLLHMAKTIFITLLPQHHIANRHCTSKMIAKICTTSSSHFLLSHITIRSHVIATEMVMASRSFAGRSIVHTIGTSLAIAIPIIHLHQDSASHHIIEMWNLCNCFQLVAMNLSSSALAIVGQ